MVSSDKRCGVDYEKDPYLCSKCPLYGIGIDVGNSIHQRIPDLEDMSYKRIDVLIIGEQPGETEKEERLPFVGDSGEFLQIFLDELDKADIYYLLTNAVKCGSDHKPTDKEITCCEVHKSNMIAFFEPKVVLLLGTVALKQFKLGDETIAKARHKVYKIGQIPILVTYHPASHIYFQNSGGTTGMDLTDEYIRVFQMVEKIVTDKPIETTEEIVVFDKDNYDKIYKEMIGDLCRTEEITIDIETNQRDEDPELCCWASPKVEILCLGVGVSDTKAYVIPTTYLNRNLLLEILQGRTVIQSNIKYDLRLLDKKYQLEHHRLQAFDDTLLYHFSLDQGNYRNGLKNLVEKYLGILDWSRPIWDVINAIDLTGRKGNFSDVPKEVLYHYNGQDCIYSFRLWKYLKKYKPAPDSYDMMKPMAEALRKMEMEGMPLDTRINKILYQELTKTIQENEQTYYNLPKVIEAKQMGRTTGEKSGNYMAPTFLRNLLKVTGKVSATKSEKTGVDCIKGDYIEEWAKDSVEWKYVQTLRDDRYVLSRYIEALDKYTYNNRLYTDFILAKVGSTNEGEVAGGTVTGRLASKPNIQNFKKDKVLLSQFQAPEGYCFVCFDYPQMELRVLAELANVSMMKYAFEHNLDLHEITARRAFGIPAGTPVPKDLRQKGKHGNFGIVYGIGKKRFQIQYGVSEEVTNRIFEAIDQEYPEIKKYMHRINRQVANGEMITTPLGRQRFFPITGDDSVDYKQYLMAGNFAIQSVASDITLLKLVEIYDKMDNVIGLRLVLPVNIVHDSIWTLIQLTPDYKVLKAQIGNICRIMSDTKTLPIRMSVPITVDKFECGYNLGMMKEFPTTIRGLDEMVSFLEEKQRYEFV